MGLEKDLEESEEIQAFCRKCKRDVELKFGGVLTIEKPDVKHFYKFYCPKCEKQHYVDDFLYLRFKKNNKWFYLN